MVTCVEVTSCRMRSISSGACADGATASTGDKGVVTMTVVHRCVTVRAGFGGQGARISVPLLLLQRAVGYVLAND